MYISSITACRKENFRPKCCNSPCYAAGFFVNSVKCDGQSKFHQTLAEMLSFLYEIVEVKMIQMLISIKII